MESGQHTLIELFEGVAARFPDRVAVTADDRDLTYRALDDRATALARRLREKGTGPGSRVGLLAPRTSALAVGLIGILKSGAAYVPVDPGSPQERISWTLEDSHLTRLVTTPELASELGELKGIEFVLADDSATAAEPAGTGTGAQPDGTGTGTERPGAAVGAEREGTGTGAEGAGVGADDLAYVIHTSGSTGVPKGVQVEHRQVVRLFGVTRDAFGFDERDVWTLFHSAAFDFSVWEFWGPLLFGGRLVVVPQETARSPQAFHELLRRERVTVLNQTPSAFARLAETDARAELPLTELRLVIFGGERLEPAALRAWFTRHGDQLPRLVNMYGITEATVHASYRPLTTADAEVPGISPIGAPLSDLAFHVLDDNGRPVPDGTPGELYLSGAGLARGYLDRPELDKERFLELADPDGTVRRCYRTGDRVVALADGDHGYLGRTDDQLKIRGYRVEPGEVEAVLLADGAVSAAVAVAHSYGDHDVRLLAYVASDLTGRDLAPRLGARAATLLPPHLRPSAYLVLPELPLTLNGKVDRARLPEPTADTVHAPIAVETDGTPHLTDTERRIAEIWRTVLDLPEVDTESDFFDLGGTSLSLLRMFAATNDAFGTDLDITVLIDGATVAALARHIDAAL
ncbi:amino acid adenylation domain-containing protein [Streptomyces sp. NPDC087294]|uniref:amino acid adenylation domain-containing protein n=1 Tax=Streptomyces sp. NPDC087294 TaxID=3365777 RepID=UPI00381F8BB9